MEKRSGLEYNPHVMGDCREIKTEVSEIGRYGAAVLGMRAEEFYAAGYESGDLVDVEVTGHLFTVPVGTSYTDVDHGETALLKIEFEDRMLLAVSNENNFASRNNIQVGDPVTIRMRQKAGYLKEYQRRSLTMGISRAEYPSDEAFCNFRAVKAGKMRENYLYRGFSPINPTENRADQADRLLSQTEVKTVINLDGEGPEARAAYNGYADRYYAGLNIIPVKMNFSVQDPTFGDSIFRVAETLIREEGPFYIHCRYGRDRTGLVFMILEALCEAAPEEIILDYMKSYENIHGLVRGSGKWNCQAEKRVNSCFLELTGTDLRKEQSGEQIRGLMEKKLMESCGFTEEMLRKLEDKLCTRC